MAKKRQFSQGNVGRQGMVATHAYIGRQKKATAPADQASRKPGEKKKSFILQVKEIKVRSLGKKKREIPH